MMTELTAADGHKLDCWIEEPEDAPKGGIVILQEIFGVTDQLKGVAKAYAALGYVVAIPALFDRQKKGAVIPFDKGAEGRDLMLASDTEKVMLDAGAAVAALADRGLKVGVIGFCWGGGLALRTAQKLDVAAAVSFYGTRLQQYLDSPAKAPVQFHCGTQDDHTPADVMEEVKAYLPEVEVYWYEAGHAFANDARASYVQDAAETAHARAQEFLSTHLA
ncbi:dienelactone hydrolase family protein [Pseudoruegeria sp. HB172150]|uniref:dienelactone hydrolase family protein n=1 Tax=Pseudoruegeria sp. HB172150 TaxID=2721164 RepID=UPI001551CDE6|nr:dienelactone hydrolase family protein [Pseudoruegeria sp. HB172150]